MNYQTAYEPPTLTVDAVIFRVVNGELQVGLTKRANQPFKDWWALPGGYSPKGETTLEALARIVRYKAGVDINRDLNYIEQLYTFDTVARDPRGHAVSVTYMGYGRDIDVTSDHSEAFEFFPVSSLPETAYDHADIIGYAHQRLISKLAYTNAVRAFLPKVFTFADIQTTYQAVLGHPLDKRNFRKKFMSLDMIAETDDMLRDGAHRPARLYRFKSAKLETLARSFD